MFLDVSVLKGIFKRKVLCTMKTTRNILYANANIEIDKPETARLHQGRNIIAGLKDQEVEKINRIQEAPDTALRDIVDKAVANGKRQTTVVQKLYPIIRDDVQLSKILALSGKDKRHVNLKLMAALRHVYGVDLNKLVDDLMVS